MAKPIPTAQQIDALYERAIRGDQAAIDEIGVLNQTMSKRANTRMRDLELKDMATTAAYSRAKYWISEEYGGEYFKQNRVASDRFGVDEMVENLEKASEFLRWQTSTAAGEKRRRAKIMQKLEANDQGFFASLAGEDEESILEVKNKLFDLFQTDAWSDIRKAHEGGTNPIVAQAVEALQNGALLGDLKRAFKDYQLKTSDSDIFNVWDNWASADTYYRVGEWHTLKSPRK